MARNTGNHRPAASAHAELEKALELNARAEHLVSECAEDLAAVKTLLTAEINGDAGTAKIEHALKTSERIESKVHQVSDHLCEVNSTLAVQLVDSTALAAQLDEAAEMREAARRDAFHDVLTGLPNRALLYDRIDIELAHAARRPWTLAVMFIDLDKFKAVNDQYGHDSGDRVLCEVAQRLSQHVRKNDTISRYGGDEFVYLISDFGTRADLAAIAENLARLLRAPIDLAATGHAAQVVVGASIGIAEYPSDATTSATLISRADAAMYIAKRAASGIAFAAGAEGSGAVQSSGNTGSLADLPR